MTYYKHPSTEKNGVLCYFEIGDDLRAIRQMEVGEKTVAIQYDQQHRNDQFGKLYEDPINPTEFLSYAISEKEFEAAWGADSPLNK